MNLKVLQNFGHRLPLQKLKVFYDDSFHYQEGIELNYKIENNNNEDKIGAFQFQQLESFETKLTEKIFDLPILNVQGGTYPSSKINCVIGQVMLSVWGTITFCHI